MLYAQYNPNFFEPLNIEDAKKIILTDEDIPDQWESETKWTMQLFRKMNLFNKDSIVLDWGCGIGRLAKPIIEEFECKVVGVDFQPKMLEYAIEYVNHPNFIAISDKEFFQFPDDYFTVGISVWSLQHVIELKEVLKHIQRTLKFKNKLFVIDSAMKCFPIEFDDNLKYNKDPNALIVTFSEEEIDLDKKPRWVFADNSLNEILPYFSVQKVSRLSSKPENEITLAGCFDRSWFGIFTNDKKYYFYGS